MAQCMLTHMLTHMLTVLSMHHTQSLRTQFNDEHFENKDPMNEIEHILHVFDFFYIYTYIFHDTKQMKFHALQLSNEFLIDCQV